MKQMIIIPGGFQSESEENNSIEIPNNIKQICEISIYDHKQPISKNMNKKYEPQIELNEILDIIRWLISLPIDVINSNKSLKMLYKEMDSIF